MKNLIYKCFALIVVGLLGGCAGLERLPDGTYLGITTVRSFDHAHSYASRWKDTGQKDADGRPIMEELKVDKIMGVRPDGTAIVVQEKAGEKISGPSVVGQMATAAVGGTGAAFINGNTARSVAEKGKCPPGANCGTVNNISATAAADAKSKGEQNTTVKVGNGDACVAGKPCASGD